VPRRRSKSATRAGLLREMGWSRPTLKEVALLDAELAYAGTEPKEGEAEDGAEQGHERRMIGRHSDRW
jgi:hypothetical protein